MKGPRFTLILELILETNETGRNLIRAFLHTKQIIRTDRGLIAEPTVRYLKSV